MTKSDPSDADAKYRAGIGIMLLNGRDEVFVANRIDMPGTAWQMPQGGIDEGEDVRQAAYRELREEIGTDKADIVAESNGWFRYELPQDIAGKAWGGKWRGQKQKWFVMRFKGTDADINLDTEHPEFRAWKWVPVAELPAMVVSFKRQVYIDLLAEFAEFTRTPNRQISDLLDDPLIRIVMAADGVEEHELYDLLQRAARKPESRGS